MDKLGYPLKVQVRIGRCVFSKLAAPAQYSFILVKGSISSHPTPWKVSINDTVSFNAFLMLETCCNPQDQRVSLNMFSQTEGMKMMIGSASLSLKFDKLGKVRKYHVKNGKEILATIDASIYLFQIDHSLPIIESSSSILTQNNSLRNTNTVIHYDSIDPQIPKKTKKNSNNFRINNEINWTIKQFSLKENNTDSLLVKLFEEIGKKKEQIDKRQAEINEKDAQIQHIRMKELTFQKESKKIAKYKHDTTLIIEANNELIRKDDFYDEEFYKMKAEKQQMEEQVAIISSQASLKLMCLQTELDSTNKKIDNREKRVAELINQIEQSSKELNSLKFQNKEKMKLIKSLYLELKEGPHDHQSNVKSHTLQEILQLLAQHFETNHIKQDNEPTFIDVPSQEKEIKDQIQQENGEIIRKCKTLTLLRPKSLKPQSPSKEKFRQNKQQGGQNPLQVPTILEYILNLNSGKREI